MKLALARGRCGWQGNGLGAGGFQARNPIPPKLCRIWDLLHAKSYAVIKRPPTGTVLKFGEWSRVPAQASSSSSGRGSKFRGASQNSPCVASKHDVNIIKLN
ncbi:hypothetical protein AVEN_143715-1 [Araneus ventricosus]|uniref:Uncharacterized protein n=1 Tax=Araneus ventricosus TaxID=182803 RepID=A0A4Y2AQG2_ARAVE|nr:hypothetical protein AVEN_143715-1 [Araneus ventricosus]